MSSTAAKVTQCPKLKLSRNHTVTFQSTVDYTNKDEKFLTDLHVFLDKRHVNSCTFISVSLKEFRDTKIERYKSFAGGLFLFLFTNKQKTSHYKHTHTHKASKFPRDLHGRTCTSTWESEIKSLWKCPDVSLFIASSRVFLNSVREP